MIQAGDSAAFMSMILAWGCTSLFRICSCGCNGLRATGGCHFFHQGEMGLKETYEMTEARPGDATAQLVAIVCSADSISFAPYAHDSQFASLC